MAIKKVAHGEKMTKKGSSSAATKWVPSSFEESNLKKDKKEGLLAESAPIVFPVAEHIPKPPSGYRVMFLDFLLRVLSLPAHKFLRGLLFSMACSFTSSCQIRFSTLPVSSLFACLFLESTRTGFFGSFFSASAQAFR
jgi:hypothetical protein